MKQMPRITIRLLTFWLSCCQVLLLQRDRWVKLDPIKNIPELMGSSLPISKLSRNGPAARPPAHCLGQLALACTRINQNRIDLFLYYSPRALYHQNRSKFKIFPCLPSS
jgi:hypothetical protein